MSAARLHFAAGVAFLTSTIGPSLPAPASPPPPPPKSLATQVEIAKRLGSEHAPIILCGHTHVPRFVHLADGRTVINPGSVGLQAYSDLEPYNHATEVGAPHARYAVLERAKAADPWRVTFRVVTYDWDGAAARATEKGREDWAQWLRTGFAG